MEPEPFSPLRYKGKEIAERRMYKFDAPEGRLPHLYMLNGLSLSRWLFKLRLSWTGPAEWRYFTGSATQIKILLKTVFS